MDILIIDIETTGLDPQKNELFAVAALPVRVNSYGAYPLSKVKAWVVNHPVYHFDPGALRVNLPFLQKHALNEDSEIPRGCSPWVGNELDQLISDHFGLNRVTLAGKNVAGFDQPFLEAEWPDIAGQFRHREFHWTGSFTRVGQDDRVPSLQECVVRAAPSRWPFDWHDPREDVRAVFHCLRHLYNNGDEDSIEKWGFPYLENR